MRYSQFGQDEWVLKTIPDGKYFVDIGAGDGIRFSNTFALERAGWKGICVEPHLAQYRKLRQNRRCHRCRYAVAARSNTMVPFWEGLGGLNGLSGIVGYFQDDHRRNPSKGRIVARKTISLVDLLKKFGAPEAIDYLSIDTENSEYMILKAFDFSYTFKSITIEHNNLEKKREATKRLLESHGYKRVGILEVDDLYLYDH